MGFSKKWFPDYIKGYLIGMLMVSAPVFVAICFKAIQIEFSTHNSAKIIILFFIAYLIQGMGEEVFIHSFLMMSLVNRTRVWVAIIFSSVFFSALHLGNPGITVLAVINLFIFGLFNVLLTLKTDNIWGAAAMHSAWNFFQGNIWGIQVSGNVHTSAVFNSIPEAGKDLLSGGNFGIEGSVFTTVVLIISVLLLLVSSKKSKANMN